MTKGFGTLHGVDLFLPRSVYRLLSVEVSVLTTASASSASSLGKGELKKLSCSPAHIDANEKGSRWDIAVLWECYLIRKQV
jgi:hypothetical protein